MMMDWQVGDLAASDDDAPYCPRCLLGEAIGEPEYDAGDAVLTVLGVRAPDAAKGETECGLVFPGDPEPWCSCQFRKIVPDEHEACEADFVKLLKRSKQQVEV